MTTDDMFPELTSEAAKAMSALGASKGGKARANTLTPEERKEIARNAVRARWAKAGKLKPLGEEKKEPEVYEKAVPEKPRDTMPFSMFRGNLQIGDMEIECHVLNDGRRVFTHGEVVRVLTRGTDSSNLKRYLRGNPLIDNVESVGQTIPFKIPGNPTIAIGSEATRLVEICEKYLEAQDQKKLRKNQINLAIQSSIIIRACAKVGIIALVDEATGYQQHRAKNALQLKLQAFIADDLQEWARRFPPEFWIELARLEGVSYSPRNRPLRWGKYIMAFVYDAIDKDVGRELRKKNPNPHHKQNHHQWLKEFGKDKLIGQVQSVITLMKLCDNMDQFRKKFDRVFRKSAQTDLFADMEMDD